MTEFLLTERSTNISSQCPATSIQTTLGQQLPKTAADLRLGHSGLSFLSFSCRQQAQMLQAEECSLSSSRTVPVWLIWLKMGCAGRQELGEVPRGATARGLVLVVALKE